MTEYRYPISTDNEDPISALIDADVALGAIRRLMSFAAENHGLDEDEHHGVNALLRAVQGTVASAREDLEKQLSNDKQAQQVVTDVLTNLEERKQARNGNGT